MSVRARRSLREQNIAYARATAAAYYDAKAETEEAYDKGEYFVNDLNSLLTNSNRDFIVVKEPGPDGVMTDVLKYKGRNVLILIDYKEADFKIGMDLDMLNYDAIKSIYVSEDIGAFSRFIKICPDSPFIKASRYGCAVFIETHPESEVPGPVGRGVRKTFLEGYTSARKFAGPDYSETAPPDADDYRRTLYWNPSVAPDSLGRASVGFYNGSRVRRLRIDAETVSPTGEIGL